MQISLSNDLINVQIQMVRKSGMTFILDNRYLRALSVIWLARTIVVTCLVTPLRLGLVTFRFHA